MAYSFADQLKVGEWGEATLLEYYPHPLVPLAPADGLVGGLKARRKADFWRVSDGGLVEVKTDTWSMDATPNFFMERYSDREKQSPGGPWRALQDGISSFVYLFPKDRTWFEFQDLRSLCGLLDELIASKQAKKRTIPNRTWITEGWLVARDKLTNLCTRSSYGNEGGAT
jgi:hypothetical protein